MPVSPFRRPAHWVVAASIPLLVLPATGASTAAVDTAATAEPVRNANGWVRFADTTTAFVDQTVEPGLAQLQDGTLVVAWRHTESGRSTPSLVTATVGPDGTASSPTARVTWPTLGGDPDAPRTPTGGEVVFTGSDGTGGYFGAGNAYRLLVDESGQVSGPTQGRYFATGAAVDVPWTPRGPPQAPPWSTRSGGGTTDSRHPRRPRTPATRPPRGS